MPGPGQDGAASLLSAVGKMYQEAVPVDFKALFPKNSKDITELPVYPWDHSGSY
jgi:acyl transferase domain-containing protein